ncbi:uncharacterized protein SPAPADRAFT_73170 [Spathaspora passalidarum NRRL Y-27907]|uniref:Uncharacterized protein n=1 Tax=Spathaspora passalidarum (strain NRRL Y-27907 / 11-Y1) TaxID=619300 RepID=G3AU64_SPAPN|nr:uncharacterized protein SPAPADRAFT_73170 [Spathaspora passalidarum NRRL Y-27907]EGW30440.1 hypothetical protein SPAPADRAFT_73170 [Spathaspora passalidarum NRRL Y-27907]
MTSIHTIETIIDQYSTEINSLNIPTLTHFNHDTIITISPYISQFKLEQIKHSLSNINQELHKFKSNKSYAQVYDKFTHLFVDVLDEKIYVNSKLIDIYEQQNRPVEKVEQESTVEQGPAPEEDLPSLRKRLLAGGKTSSLLDSNQDITKVNEYHESIQNDILNELSGLTSNLKSSALKFSSKILGEDSNILSETQENISKNANLFQATNRNLNNYLENKTGGRIGLWFLIKITIALVMIFLFMIIFIKIIPKI